MNEAEIGSQILAYRSQKDISQIELAKATGISQTKISKFENGKLMPSESELTRLSKVINFKEVPKPTSPSGVAPIPLTKEGTAAVRWTIPSGVRRYGKR